MKATFYKGLSNIEKTRIVSAGKSVAEAFPDIDFDNAVVIVNGSERTADYILRESDVVTIRELPAATALVVGFVIAAVVTGVVVGVKMYQAKKAAEDLQKELDKMKKQSNKDDIDNRPFLRGASNTVAKDKSQPYVCGRHLFTPYLLCSPFYKISGTDGAEQHTYTVLECGFNRQVIDSVSIEDIRIKKFEGDEPQEGSYALDGGQVFAEDGMIEIAQDGEPFGELTELNYKTVSTSCNEEIPRDTKVAKGEAEYLTFTLDANAMDVEVAISFPYGLYAYNDDGGKISTKVTITPQYSLDGGKTWNVDGFGFSNGASRSPEYPYNYTVFSKNISSKELRYVAKKTFTLEDYRVLSRAGQKNILLRVRSDGNDDSMIKNDCYVLFYQSRCFDPNKSSYPAGTLWDATVGLVPCQILEDRERAFCTLMGLRVKASTNNEDKLKKINVVTQGTARTWNGRQWSGTKSPTRNAAAWALEILTSDSHPMSRFADSEIDMESFGEFYAYCESNRFYFDYVITQGRKKGDTLNMILNNCGASLYWDIYGRLAVAIDTSKDNAIAVYNPQNIISIQNKKTFGRRTDGLRVKYVSGADDIYQEDTYLLMREVDGKPLELNADSAIKDITVTGITTFEHIVKYARRMMALEILRPKTTTIEVGNEGIYFTPYSKILLQDDSLKIGTGNGTIKALQWADGKLEKIFLDSPVTFEDGKRYGAIVNCFGENKAVPLSLKVSGSGFTDALTVETLVSDGDGTIPETGCVVSFGELDNDGNFGRITTPYLISNISRTDKGFRLELVNYNEAVYHTGTIPDYKSNITQKPAVNNAAIPPDFVTKDEMMEAIANGIDTSAEPPDTPIVSECTAYRDYISARIDPLPEEKKNEIFKTEWQVNKDGFWEDFLSNISFSGRYEFAREKDGYPEAEDLNWQIRCRITNTRGISSEWSEPRKVDTSEYGTWRPLAARNASARTYSSEHIYLSFSPENTSERQYYGSTRFNVTISYDGKPLRTETDAPFGMYYYFDRETDGYPERHENAGDGIRDLSLYSFTIRPVETYTGEIGKVTEVGVDESFYRTWRVPEVRTSATAQEHYVMLQWGLDGEIPYGTLRYDLHLGSEPVAKNLTAGYHAYRFAENLTKEEVSALAFTVTARNEAHESTAEFSVDASAYLGYKVEKPWISASARKEGIDISWGRTNDFYGKCEYVLLKDGEEILRGARETEHFLRFGEDEFPEREDIEKTTLQVRIEGDADSATSEPAETDLSGYLTWIPQVPKAYPSASGRSASLSWDAQDGVYGFTGCEIQIAKGYTVSDGKMSPVTDAAELEWYAPALGLNPYESVENYKRGEPGGRLEVSGGSVSFALPLFGQDADRASDTPYAFRLRGKTSAGKVSGWTDALFVVCKAVSAHDVVGAWELDDKGERVKVDGALGAAQIFVEELSAITANLGYITDGALRGNAYNYWAVSDTPMDDGSTLWRGSFRVGGSDQYILVEPRLKDGVPTGEYDITFVVGNYSVSATGTQIRGGTFEVYDEDGNLVFSASQDGARTLVETATHSPDETDAELYNNYIPIPMTVKCGDDVFLVIPLYEEDANSYYKVAVYRLAGKSFEEWWTLTGFQASALYYVIAYSQLLFADAPDGKFLFPYQYSEENDTAGTWTVDILARSMSFDPLEGLTDIDGDIKGSLATRGCLFLNLVSEDDEEDSEYLNLVTLWKGGFSVLFDEPVLASSPAVSDNAFFLGAAVHGGFAYAAYTVGYYTFVFRTSPETGERQFCAIFGKVLPDKSLYDEFGLNSLMVDDENITLFNVCQFFDGDRGLAEPFVGAARIPQDSAEWQPWSGDIDDLNFVPSPFRAYRMPHAPEGTAQIPCTAFLYDADLAVLKMMTETNNQTARAVRLAFADDAEREEPLYGGVVAGSLEESPLVEWKLDESDITEFYHKIYEIYSFAGLYGMAFPARLDGLDAVRMSHYMFDMDYSGFTNQRWRVLTKYLERRTDVTGSEVMPVGTGFTRVSREPINGSTRYYLASGEYIEFNEDGTLAATTGAQGPQGAAGRDGRDGRDGATPEISVSATVDGGSGTPTVEVARSGTAERPEFSLEFKNLKGERGERGEKGEKGDDGERGADAGFGNVTATYAGDDGEPRVDVSASGSDSAKDIEFSFSGLKGDKGDEGEPGKDGASIARVEQVKSSADDGGENVMEVYDSDGKKVGEFTVKNGKGGGDGTANNWSGTQEEFDAAIEITDEDDENYIRDRSGIDIYDDEDNDYSIGVSNKVREGDFNAVTSDAVYKYIEERLKELTQGD